MPPPKRFYWLNVAIIAAFAAVAVFGIVTYANTRTIRASERRVARSHAVREATHELLSSIKDMQTGQRGYLLTGEDSFLQPYRVGLEAVDKNFATLAELTQENASQQEQLRQLRRAYEEKRDYLAKTITLRTSEPQERVSDEVLNMIRVGRGEAVMEEARDTVRAILDEEAATLARAEASSARLTIISETAITAGHLLALGLILLAGFAARDDRHKRDQAEAAMLQQQQELAAVIDSAFEGIVTFDDQLTIRMINPAAAAMHRVDPADGIGQRIDQWLPPRLRESFVTEVQQLGGSDACPIEYIDAVWLRSDGEEFPAEGSLARSVTDREQFFTLKLRDLSEAKASEAKQREHVAILRQLRDAVIVCDMNDRVVSWNHGSEELFGILESDAIGQNVESLLFIDQPDLWQRSRTMVSQRGRHSHEFSFTTADGRTCVLEQRHSFINDANDQPTAQLVFTIDVSNRKHEEAKQRRSQRLESIGTLAGGVAHDLNNVLTPILMSGKLLRRGSPNAERLYDTIVTSAERGSKMIKKLLAFAGGDATLRSAVDVRDILLEVEEILSHTLPKTIDLQVHTAIDLDSIQADSTELSQVVMNLAINARDAMPDGGTLVIEASNVVVDAAQSKLSDNLSVGPHVCLTVEDNGHGIAKEIMERIFDPFFTTKPQGQGTGLGLATTLGIVRSYGGDIVVHSEPAAGTTFTIYLPSASSPQATTSLVDVDLDAPVGHGETILIVDDEVMILETAREILESHQYQVLTASSGKDAIATFQHHRDSIQLVLLDMMMPGMDGLETKDALHRVDPRLPIIASSGLRRPTHDGQRLADVSRFLSKPYNDEQLLRIVHRVLRTQAETRL